MPWTETIMAAERDKSYSHGVFRLPGYVASLRSGKVNGKAKPKVSDMAPAAVKVDADNGFAPLALKVGRDPLAAKAKSQGIAVQAITRTYHFAALWPETAALAEEGLAAFAFTSAKPTVAPAGGIKPVFGTNPMSFAWPREGHPPMVFDLATAAMARGEIMIAAREGHAVPEGCGITADGTPTTDPGEILKGAQLAFGGYKGALLSLMVELLAGPLIGEVFSTEQAAADNNDGGPAIGGELLIAIDPVTLSGGTGAPGARRKTLRGRPRARGRPAAGRPALRQPRRHRGRRRRYSKVALRHDPRPALNPRVLLIQVNASPGRRL